MNKFNDLDTYEEKEESLFLMIIKFILSIAAIIIVIGLAFYKEIVLTFILNK